MGKVSPGKTNSFVIVNPKIEIDLFVYNVPKCGVKCEVDKGQYNIKEASRSGNKITYDGDKKEEGDMENKKFEISSSRMNVMYAPDAKKLKKEMDGNAVAYLQDYYPTEVQYLALDMVKTKQDFESKKKSGTYNSLKDHNVNEILIFWDTKKNKVTSYAIDGEVIDIT